ncbi:MAG: VOC family protein [Leptolyngbyaceae cyanobacterium bins.59]|nr:VOC family protein [Leptolyngbyaceae cyanobacterium bins.59]
MTDAVSSTEVFRTVTPHLTVQNAQAAIEFYQKAFGAQEQFRMMTPDGKAIMHCVIKIGNSLIFLNDEFPDWGSLSPKAFNGSAVTIHLQVEDADRWFEQAVSAGATVTMPLENMFWGDRYGKLVDPFGHHWSIATEVEQVSPEEMEKRVAAFAA